MGDSQKILVFQQQKSGEKKIRGIIKYGGDKFDLKVISIDFPLPEVIEDAVNYLPKKIRADLVLDFFKHQDLSYDLALICRDCQIPVIASGNKMKVEGAITPPT